MKSKQMEMVELSNGNKVRRDRIVYNLRPVETPHGDVLISSDKKVYKREGGALICINGSKLSKAEKKAAKREKNKLRNQGV